MHAGGATALLSLRLPHRLAGVVALSAYLPLRDGPGPVVSPENMQTTVLMLHGDADPTVRPHSASLVQEAWPGMPVAGGMVRGWRQRLAEKCHWRCRCNTDSGR